MPGRSWIVCGSLCAALGVALGAFGAHALKERLAPEDLADWGTAVDYQLWHSLALILLGVVQERLRAPAWIGWLFLLGILGFSGSIYCLALSIGESIVWPLTPLGGMLFLLAWLSLARAAWRSSSRTTSRTP